MLDKFIIFTKTGFILFEKNWTTIRGNPIGQLISNTLIEERSSTSSTTVDSYALKWETENTLDLIFVACYQKVLQLAYIDKLLGTVRKHFVSTFADELHKMGSGVFPDTGKYEKVFLEILKSCENVQLKSGSQGQAQSPVVQPKVQQPKVLNKKEEKASKDDKKKKSRTWGDKLSKGEAEALDYSESVQDETIGDQQRSSAFVDEDAMAKISRGKSGYEIPEMEDVADKKDAPKSSWSRLFDSLTGNKTIAQSDLEPLLKVMKEDLVKKNVAHEIADNLCQTVSKSLIGTSVGTFESVKSVLSKSMEAAVRKILTPSTSTDILREIQVAKQQRRPYTITFIGVNGVGKSTNLSKVCFWLLQNKLSVLVAACDTFRSGAVEQLGVHIRNLSQLDSSCRLELFQKGYGKDAALIAKDAIQYARENDYEVVLIDTAGRMQNNEPLMRSLAKLVSVNNPDKVIFVGEALVGNEAIDQLSKFNQALKDFSGVPNPRQIDGMILSKFDTIDEKVGAALSMTYVTGKPVFFVGTGQTYTDLKKMNISQIVRSLLE